MDDNWMSLRRQRDSGPCFFVFVTDIKLLPRRAAKGITSASIQYHHAYSVYDYPIQEYVNRFGLDINSTILQFRLGSTAHPKPYHITLDLQLGQSKPFGHRGYPNRGKAPEAID